MSTRPFRHAGFTLIEVLVALTLLALMIAMGYGAIRTAIRSARSGEALIARTEELRTAQAFLRRQLSNLLAMPYEVDERDGVAFQFEGSRDWIRFVAPMPGHLSRGGAHVQQLSWVDERAGLRLEFRHSQLNGFDPEEPVGGDRDPVVLIAGVADAGFEFRSRELDGSLGDWVDEWDEPHTVPVEVRLWVEFDDDDARRWPPMEVPVRSAFNQFGPVAGPGVAPPDVKPPGRAPRPTQ